MMMVSGGESNCLHKLLGLGPIDKFDTGLNSFLIDFGVKSTSPQNFQIQELIRLPDSDIEIP